MRPPKTKKSTVKSIGLIFTPDFLVKNMLDFCGYAADAVVGRHFIDNSCGSGAFLAEAVTRYIGQAQQNGMSREEIRLHLETYIHGIELDKATHAACIARLDLISSAHDIRGVKWDILQTNTLRTHQFDGKMDFVVGNPPYVRVHNLDDSYAEVKGYTFADSGMTDLYLVFYEIGLRMLAPHGKLCYIAPNSWLTSLAGQKLREYVLKVKNLAAVIDLEHFQPFKAATYTLITLFQGDSEHDTFDYYRYDSRLLDYQFICPVSYSDVCLHNYFYLSTPDRLHELRQIKECAVPKSVTVKNGFATLADDFFIGEVPESPFTIDIVKASTGRWTRCLYPYDKEGHELPQERLFAVPEVVRYYTSHRNKLKNRTSEGEWLYFGRSQAIKDVQREKIAVNTVIKDRFSLKINRVKQGAGVYSGLYILPGNIPCEDIEALIDSKDFIDYVKALKKYKNGGYYTFNSKDLEQYLNYKLFEKKPNETCTRYRLQTTTF